MDQATRLSAEAVTLAYGGGGEADPVIADLSLAIPDGQITTIIGPNGCGKSTLLRALARLMTPTRGTVWLDGAAIQRQPTKDVARRLGLLPQQPEAPQAITVGDLVRRGRYPHHGFFAPPGDPDRAAVARALELAGVAELSDRPVDTLSGGQRQRAWIAMALAQEPGILLLDEPTTYLDPAHQQAVLALIRKLNRETGQTALLVLHDVNQAATVSDYVVALRAGAIVTQGNPAEVIAPEPLESVFDVPCDVVRHPGTGRPVATPRGRVATDPTAAGGNAGIPPEATLSMPGATATPALHAQGLAAGYQRGEIIQAIDLAVPAGAITAIIGPNACGKSTLLRTLARLLIPSRGHVCLHGQPIAGGPRENLARQLAILLQGTVTPPGYRVADIVAAGRYPYQRWYRQWSRADAAAVDQALAATDLAALRWRPVETLSGGQRQRVWLAMALAQETDLLLLDEPTTFLDMAHQVATLDLIHNLNRQARRSVVLVLHDLGQACRYADYLVAMKDGQIAAAGRPSDIVTPELVRDLFGIASAVVADPVSGGPLVLPVPETDAGSVAVNGGSGEAPPPGSDAASSGASRLAADP